MNVLDPARGLGTLVCVDHGSAFTCCDEAIRPICSVVEGVAECSYTQVEHVIMNVTVVGATVFVDCMSDGFVVVEFLCNILLALMYILVVCCCPLNDVVYD